MRLKAGTLRELSLEDLHKKATEISGEMFKIRIEARSARTATSPKVRNLRRDLARVKTVLGEKEKESGGKE